MGLLKLLPVSYPVDDVLLIDITKLYLRYVISLYLIDTKALHQVGNNVLFKLCITDDANCLIDIKEDLLKTFKEMELILLLTKVISVLSCKTFPSPDEPLVDYLLNAQDPGITVDQDIEVTGE